MPTFIVYVKDGEPILYDIRENLSDDYGGIDVRVSGHGYPYGNAQEIFRQNLRQTISQLEKAQIKVHTMLENFEQLEYELLETIKCPT